MIIKVGERVMLVVWLVMVKVRKGVNVVVKKVFVWYNMCVDKLFGRFV